FRHERFSKPLQANHDLFALSKIAAPRRGEEHDRLSIRSRHDAGQYCEFVRRSGSCRRITAQYALRLRPWKEDQPTQDGLDRMKAQARGRHHAEIAAAAAQRPEQVGILHWAGSDEPAVGEDNIDAEQIVDGEAKLPVQRAIAAAGLEPGHARSA